MRMKITWYGRSEQGHRDNNEDAFVAGKAAGYWFFAVADGLGGHMAGERASAMACAILREEAEKGIPDPQVRLGEIAHIIHGMILQESLTNRKVSGMATTLVTALVSENGKAWIMNIGDSRAYLVGTAVRHTKDQSVVESLVDSGKITREEAKTHPLRVMVLQALGDPESTIEPDFYRADLRDSILLLSSDGLHDSVDKDTIGAIIRAHQENPALVCDMLIAKALECGSGDNITTLLVKAD
jgi:protein phosphatase